MAIQHVDITDPDIHEPKGASTASAGSGYFSDGAGSGTWTKVGSAHLDTASVNSYIQTQIDEGNISARQVNYITAVLDNVSQASSVLLPILDAGTITRIQVVFTGAITGSDPTITFLNSSGAGMGPPLVVIAGDTAKGSSFITDMTGNNVSAGDSWIEVVTDGVSTGAVPLVICAEIVHG